MLKLFDAYLQGQAPPDALTARESLNLLQRGADLDVRLRLA